jgi:hypothetical protein
MGSLLSLAMLYLYVCMHIQYVHMSVWITRSFQSESFDSLCYRNIEK